MTTAAEISRLAGVSTATVSRALNNSGSVSAKAREAVLNAVRESNYPLKRPTRAVKTDGTQRSEDAGLIEIVLHRRAILERVEIDDGAIAVGPLERVRDDEMLTSPYRLSCSFYRHVIDGAIEELNRWGRRAVLQNSSNLSDPKLTAELKRPGRNGILLLGQDGPDVAAFLAQSRYPVVLMDMIRGGECDVVTTDNTAGIFSAFDHLFQLGHRDIGFVGRCDTDAAFAERFTAYRMKMADSDLVVREAWTYSGPNHIESTAAGVRSILAGTQRPTAFLCANDCSALAVVRAASACGLSIPDDLSVVGFDGDDFAPMVTPPLSTVDVQMAEIGRQAVRQLMIHIQGGPTNRTSGCRIRLAPQLVLRQSTGRVPARTTQ